MFDCLSDLELHFSNLARWYLTPRQWVFAQFTQVDPKLEMEIVLIFLRYWGLRHNWNMCNTFVFDGRHGVKAYLRKLKGVLLWQFSLLEQVEILSCFHQKKKREREREITFWYHDATSIPNLWDWVSERESCSFCKYQLLNGSIPLKIPPLSCAQHLVVSWHEVLSLFIWTFSSCRELPVSSQLLCCGI